MPCQYAIPHRRAQTREPTGYLPTSPNEETILVVEDEALRELTERIFTRSGYRVITAANGPQALDIARGPPGEIHLLVTDVILPHMLGKEVAEKMQAVKPGIEVLNTSGYARSVLASQGRLDLGVALVGSRSPRPTCWPGPGKCSTTTSGDCQHPEKPMLTRSGGRRPVTSALAPLPHPMSYRTRSSGRLVPAAGAGGDDRRGAPARNAGAWRGSRPGRRSSR
ncbi:MAG: response regulator [Streptosporangiaceae bacterium]